MWAGHSLRLQRRDKHFNIENKGKKKKKQYSPAIFTVNYNFCSVPGCIILWKEATAIRDHCSHAGVNIVLKTVKVGGTRAKKSV